MEEEVPVFYCDEVCRYFTDMSKSKGRLSSSLYLRIMVSKAFLNHIMPEKVIFFILPVLQMRMWPEGQGVVIETWDQK